MQNYKYCFAHKRHNIIKRKEYVQKSFFFVMFGGEHICNANFSEYCFGLKSSVLISISSSGVWKFVLLRGLFLSKLILNSFPSMYSLCGID